MTDPAPLPSALGLTHPFPPSDLLYCSTTKIVPFLPWDESFPMKSFGHANSSVCGKTSLPVNSPQEIVAMDFTRAKLLPALLTGWEVTLGVECPRERNCPPAEQNDSRDVPSAPRAV